MNPALLRRLEDLLGPPEEPPRPVAGGDINAAHAYASARGRFFVKSNDRLGAGAFAAEAEGLRLLEAAGALRVPAVIAAGEAGGAGFLVLEWLAPGSESAASWRALGRGLAALHARPAPGYGLEHDNFIGRLPQENSPGESWPRFWAERRIAPQLRLAVDGGRLGAPLRQRVERLVAEAERACRREGLAPSLLHGDLWRGNVLFLQGGAPAVIDPAVYRGDREVELAFTELFGGFDPAFYAAYEEALPLAPGYAERRGYWQLYPLLVHLNLFGGSYLGGVERAVRAGEALVA